MGRDGKSEEEGEKGEIADYSFWATSPAPPPVLKRGSFVVGKGGAISFPRRESTTHCGKGAPTGSRHGIVDAIAGVAKSHYLTIGAENGNGAA